MIAKLLLSLTLTLSLLWGELYRVDHFTTDIFSRKGNSLTKIDMNIMFEGEKLRENDYRLLDALNVIVSSFYLEDLFTSKGKERFKKLLKAYILKKYMLDIDFVYILKMEIVPQIDTEKLLQQLKQNGIGAPIGSGAKKRPRKEEKAFEMME